MSNKKIDISHLPSPEELQKDSSVDISHLPPPEVLSKPSIPEDAPKPEWSKLESFGQGAKQGATLGFSDELSGLLGTIKEQASNPLKTLTGNYNSQEIEDLYARYRDMERQKNKQAEEQNPVSYFTGNLGGGVASSLVAPGLMAPKTIMGMTGLGTAAGIGTSNADLTSGKTDDLQTLGKDATIGAGLGYGAGILSHLGGALLTPTANKLTNVAKTSAEYAEQGIPVSGELGLKEAEKDISNVSKQISEAVVDAREAKKKAIYSPVEKAAQGKTVNLQQWADNASQMINDRVSDPDVKSLLLDEVNNVVNGQLKPEFVGNINRKTIDPLDKLGKEAAKTIEQNKQLGIDSTANLATNSDESLLTKLVKTTNPEEPSIQAKTVENAPAFSKFKPQYGNDIRQGGTPDLDLKKAQEIDSNLTAYIQKAYNSGDLSSINAAKTLEGIQNSLREEMEQGFPGYKKAVSDYRGLKNFERNENIEGQTKSLDYSSPEPIRSNLQKLTEDTLAEDKFNQFIEDVRKLDPNLADKIKDMGMESAKRFGFVQSVQGHPPLDLKGAAKHANRYGTPIAAKVGEVYAGFSPSTKRLFSLGSKLPYKDIARQTILNPYTQEQLQRSHNQSPATQLSSAFYNSSNEQLADYASKLSKVPGMQINSQKLMEAIQSNDQDMKNKLFFILRQTPAANQLMLEHFGVTNE